MSAFPSSTKISEPTEMLLVVDDDSLVRDLETRILRLQGYTVLQAEGAAEALRLAREAAAIHLLITDELLHKVRRLLDATAPLPIRKPSRSA